MSFVVNVNQVANQVEVVRINFNSLFVLGNRFFSLAHVLQSSGIVNKVLRSIFSAGDVQAEQFSTVFFCFCPVLQSYHVVELHTAHEEVVLIAGSYSRTNLSGKVKRFLIFLTEEQKLNVTDFVLLEVVRVLDVLAILFSSLRTEVAFVVLLSKFALSQCRVRILCNEFLEAFGCHSRVHVEVSVGILHISLFVVGFVGECKFILAGSCTVVLFSSLHVAFQDVNVRVLGIGLTSLFDVLGNFLCISCWVSIVVGTGNCCVNRSILLVNLQSGFELLFGSLLVVCLEVERTECDVVVWVVGIGSNTLVVEVSCACYITLRSLDMTKIAICLALYSC